MEMKEQLQLSEGEAQLLRALCYARMVVLKAGEEFTSQTVYSFGVE